VDQARQDELRARNRYIIAVERYLDSLDRYKLDLSLPLGYNLVLNEQPLKDLETAGLFAIPYQEEEALEIAINSRLDLLNEIDRFEDSFRKIKVAANQLKANVNLFGNVSLDSKGATDYTKFDLNDYRASLGLGINLPFDRLRERTLYRSSLIDFERQIRTLGLAIDSVRTDIRQSLRTLDQAHQTYLIQQRSVQVADRRLEAQNLLLEAGRAEMRDLLEAEAAQLQARNALTQALIDYHVARYGLLRDMGILEVDEEGIWIRTILSQATESPEIIQASQESKEVITPEELFAQ
jgi:outer membrane protein TolC